MTLGKGTKKNVYWQVVIIVAIIFIGSLFALFSTAPDQIFVRSKDGFVALKAVTHSSCAIQIVLDEGTQGSVDELASPIYEIETNTDAFIQDGELEMVVGDEWGSELDITELAFYYFDGRKLVWTPLPTTFDLAKHSVQAPLEFTGNLLVGVGER